METANGAKQSYENTDYQWIIWIFFSLTITKAFLEKQKVISIMMIKMSKNSNVSLMVH